MNNINHQAMVQEAVKSSFKGSKTVEPKVAPKFPMSAEREMQRVAKSYMKLINNALKKHMPELLGLDNERTDSRYDGFSIEWKLRRIMQQVAEEIEQSSANVDLEKYLEKIGQLAKTQSTREWRKTVKKVLGVNILDDYYNGEMYEEVLKQWISNNVSLIKSLPNETLGTLEQTILDGYSQGKSLRQIKKEIQAEYDTTMRYAELLSRDQISTLNAQITKLQQTDAGVTRYKWSTSKDSRVRECHKELDGKIISWDDPPEMWYRTKKGKVYTGRKCHAGEDFYCRCVAIPVFDWETIDVPISGEK